MKTAICALLIDGNSDDRALTRRTLERAIPGIVIEEITDEISFVRWLDSGQFQLVITDYCLGWSDGLSILRRVKDQAPDCPVIMFTASGTERFAAEAISNGPDDYVIKDSTHVHRLPLAIRNAVERAHQRTLLRQQQAIQRRNEIFLDSLYNSLPDAVLVIDADGRINQANRFASDQFGFRADELQSLTITDLLTERSSRLFDELLESLRTGQASLTESHALVITARKRDGTVFPGDLHASPISINSESMVICVIRELTEHRQLEEQLRQSQKMEAVGRLAGGIAHDFNNLLTVILGFSELMISTAKAGDPIREMAEQIKAAGERAASLTRQLLAFSRKQVVKFEVIQLNQMVINLGKMLHRLIGENIQLQVRAQSDLWPVHADLSQMEQLIVNLVVNARDSMESGGKLIIDVRNFESVPSPLPRSTTKLDGHFVLVSVTDTGCGMDQETQSRIFEPFFTTKKDAGRTGLGLSTVYGSVKQMGGHIEVESKLDVGTTLRVYLPRSDKVALSSPMERSTVTTPAAGMTLLLAEDDASLRRLARTVLTQAGYAVIDAANGDEACRAAAEYSDRIHMLITDVVMPRMNGGQLADRLRAERPDLRVLFMSGYTDDQVLRHGIRDASVAFLQKPFSTAQLLEKVAQVLATK